LAGFLHCALETRWQRFGQFLNGFLNDFLYATLDFLHENIDLLYENLSFSLKNLNDFLYYFLTDK